jgi:16S rRNA (uracil1498-N3)-methyltransferase
VVKKERYRFIVEKSYLKRKNNFFFIEEKDFYHHCKDVLRLKENSRIVIYDGEGGEYKVKILSYKGKGVEVKIEDRQQHLPPLVKIIIAQALLNPISKLDDFISKAAELGVWAIMPIYTARSQCKRINIERWERIIKRAAACARSPFSLNLYNIQSFEEAIEQVREEGALAILLDENTNLRLRDLTLPDKINSIFLFIGPEGGFTDSELDYAKKKNVLIASLGERVLGADFAGIVASSLIMYRFGIIG